MIVINRLGKQTLAPGNPPSLLHCASVAGQKEAEGPLGAYFDETSRDSYFGQNTWEKAESAMLRRCFDICCGKAGITPRGLDCILSGDLLNQCIGSAFALRDTGVPHFGLYGACSTMGEALTLGSIIFDSGAARLVCAAASSHFCSSERQYRFPLEYGGQRTPTAQWTVTGAGCAILGAGEGPYITLLTPGVIVDAGITDANNMGSAMAPAAYETLKAHFDDTGRSPDYYDAIFTGDLGALGHDALEELFRRDGATLGASYYDCGVLIYDRLRQDVHAGGSGCGCSASVLASYIMRGFDEGRWSRVLFAPTGALMSPTSAQQGDSIPGICHALAIEKYWTV